MIPSSLEEAANEIYNMNTSAAKQALNMPMEKFVLAAHHNLGQWIRNNWGLWKQTGGLYEELSQKGLTHPDDMSTVVLKYFHAKFNNENFDLLAEVKSYAEYWDKAKK